MVGSLAARKCASVFRRIREVGSCKGQSSSEGQSRSTKGQSRATKGQSRAQPTPEESEDDDYDPTNQADEAQQQEDRVIDEKVVDEEGDEEGSEEGDRVPDVESSNEEGDGEEKENEEGTQPVAIWLRGPS